MKDKPFGKKFWTFQRIMRNMDRLIDEEKHEGVQKSIRLHRREGKRFYK